MEERKLESVLEELPVDSECGRDLADRIKIDVEEKFQSGSAQEICDLLKETSQSIGLDAIDANFVQRIVHQF